MVIILIFASLYYNCYLVLCYKVVWLPAQCCTTTRRMNVGCNREIEVIVFAIVLLGTGTIENSEVNICIKNQ